MASAGLVEVLQLFKRNDGVLGLFGSQSSRQLAVMKLTNFFLRRFFRFAVGSKRLHTTFASHAETNAVKCKTFGRTVDFRPLPLEFDFDRKFHFAPWPLQILCKFSLIPQNPQYSKGEWCA